MTKVFKINPAKIDSKAIRECAELIKKGKLVVFPTETVYGLGADALNEKAVKGIFRAKGRPSDNPLIVHISSIEMLRSIVTEVPPAAKKLMSKFWPGPLSIVFKSNGKVAESVTAGLPTVAVRMPDHKVALALIMQSEVPIAAPSANISGKPSVTWAVHAIEDLKDKVDAIIDSKYCKYGLESTVIDLTTKIPTLLRPGTVTLEQLERILGEVKVANPNARRPKSPGMKYRHYAPETEFILVKAGNDVELSKKLTKFYNELKSKKKKVMIIGSSELHLELGKMKDFYVVGRRKNLPNLGANIFKVLRELDKKGLDCILMGSCPEQGVGRAIMNRLKKASSSII